MKRAPMSAEERARISTETKARMANPAVRALISERTKAGMLAANGQLGELRLLRAAWQSVAPDTRIRFLNEVFALACSASARDGEAGRK